MNFAEVWLARVIALFTTLNTAPWLDGIEELDTEVLEVGSGTVSEQNIIHIPVENFKPEVLINNSSYPIALQSFTDTEATVQLDKYQTKVTTLTDDQIMGASYRRIDSATRGHVIQINSNKYKKALHALAPSANTQQTPVIKLADFGGDVYKAIVALKKQFDLNDVPVEGRRLVLCADHYNALLNDRDRFANLLANMTTGQAAPVIAGFEIYSYLGAPTYSSSGNKNAFGAVPQAGDVPASVAFWKGNVAKKTGMTKQYFSPADSDPENQTNKLNYRHYFIAVPAKLEAMGAISGATDVPVTGVSIVEGATANLGINKTLQLHLAFTPAHASNQMVTWSTANASDATVTQSGLVKALKNTGTVVITVTTADGSHTDSITITMTA